MHVDQFFRKNRCTWIISANPVNSFVHRCRHGMSICDPTPHLYRKPHSLPFLFLCCLGVCISRIFCSKHVCILNFFLHGVCLNGTTFDDVDVASTVYIQEKRKIDVEEKNGEVCVQRRVDSQTKQQFSHPSQTCTHLSQHLKKMQSSWRWKAHSEGLLLLEFHQ